MAYLIPLNGSVLSVTGLTIESFLSTITEFFRIFLGLIGLDPGISYVEFNFAARAKSAFVLFVSSFFISYFI